MSIVQRLAPEDSHMQPRNAPEKGPLWRCQRPCDTAMRGGAGQWTHYRKQRSIYDPWVNMHTSTAAISAVCRRTLTLPLQAAVQLPQSPPRFEILSMNARLLSTYCQSLLQLSGNCCWLYWALASLFTHCLLVDNVVTVKSS